MVSEATGATAEVGATTAAETGAGATATAVNAANAWTATDCAAGDGKARPRRLTDGAGSLLLRCPASDVELGRLQNLTRCIILHQGDDLEPLQIERSGGESGWAASGPRSSGKTSAGSPAARIASVSFLTAANR